MSCVLACAGSGRAPAHNELSPGVVFPTTLAEGHNDSFVPVRAPAASASADPVAAPAPPVSATAVEAAPPPPASSAQPPNGPPDPEPLRLAEQWEYDLDYDAGKVLVGSVRPRRFDTPIVSARRFGRFAIELWIGPELIERVRFDFPGLGMEAPPEGGMRRPLYPPTSFSKGVHVRQTVLVPAAPRARRAVLVDRATGETQALAWPPDHPLAPAAPAQ
ncbi:MAG: hypothetical protein QM756_28305 [Polyangiaceae bacterium]